ncbi:MAG: lytic transglycosylase domain-containing protein [Bdellovibrionales bacterium]|nr:lytic transglycosylase domain-containing protein [Bdellovibrionales bacterium]
MSKSLLDARKLIVSDQAVLFPRLDRVRPVEVLNEYQRLQGNPGLGLVRSYEKGESQLPELAEVLAEYQIPPDFLIIPFIESDFRSHVVSPRGAAGLWQFTKVTGRHYGLRVGVFRDERKNPVLSTRAAAKHLYELYLEFHDWPLALAAYNAGAGRVRQACKEYQICDYWVLVRKLQLPPQTRRYVPRLIASLLFLEDKGLWMFSESTTTKSLTTK